MNPKYLALGLLAFPFTQGCAEVVGDDLGFGGATSGGTSNSTGGKSSTGGFMATGGFVATGGATTGGGVSTGGATTGGSATGGTTTGGTATGGTATGGAATGGAVGTGGSVSGCASSGPVNVKYKVEQTGTTTSYVGGQIVMNNVSASPIDLANIEIRYYFTDEVSTGAGTQSQQQNWAFIRQPQATINTTIARVALGAAVTKADSYISFKFNGAGSLAAGQHTIFSWQTNKTGGGTQWDQSNDYSSDGSASADPEAAGTATTDKIVVLNSGTLAWGCAP